VSPWRLGKLGDGWPLRWRRRAVAVEQLQERPAKQLQEFLVSLGGALVSTGTAVTDIKRTLQRVAIALGSPDAVVVIFPTAVFVAVPGEDETHFDLSEPPGGGVLFDRAARIYGLVDRAIAGRVTAAEGIQELADIRVSKPRFTPPVRILGHGLIAVAVGMILAGSDGATLGITFVLGLLMGGMKFLVRSGSYAAILLPTLAALIIGLASFAAANLGLIPEPLGVLVPAIVTLLPGGLLTVAVQELAAGDMLAGASRLVYGTAQLVFLAFGVVVASKIIDVPVSLDLTRAPGVVGVLTPWAGILVMALGFFLYFCGPRLSLLYLTGVLLVAYAVQVVGQLVGGSLLSGFLAAIALTVAAYLVQALPGAPPAVVCFLPAFWLLVPGAAGLIGLTQSAGGAFGTSDIWTVIGSLVTVALGVLAGMGAYRVIYRLAPERWGLRLL
jgi:uncharacterized membrane protein YjjP (DUF1212 family)